MNRLLSLQAALSRHQDLILVSLVVAVIMLMLFPLPYWVMDGLIALNIGLSVLILMAAIYAPEALEMSTFPSLLLFTTLLRLGLNIASTKLILLHAHAGEVIETFGRLVVGGNYVVGSVVFLIITIVQFIVIAKGSERVAEVGARFTLDAMPGKQMSIDADLRAGMLTASDARTKRRQIERESQLHGGMDGAMKFVKGDAIAGLIISVVCIVAGIAIGTLMLGMSAGEAAARFAILTIGDSMVSQIPSLFVSIAAGVLVTRVAGLAPEASNLGRDIGQQLTANPKALLIAASIMTACVLIPGFPVVQFAVLALVFGCAGWVVLRHKRIAARSGAPANPQSLLPRMVSFQREGSKSPPPAMIEAEVPSASPLVVRVSLGLAQKLQPGILEAAVGGMRMRVAELTGLPFPGLRMLADHSLSGESYVIQVYDVPMGGRQLTDDLLAVPQPPAVLNASGIEVKEEGQGLPPGLSWVEARHARALQERGLAPLANEPILARHLGAVMLAHPTLFIGIQETKVLLSRAEAEFPDIVSELTKSLPLQRIAEVLRRLVEEDVPIKDLRAIFEALIVWGPKEKDPVLLGEHARMALSRQITHRYADAKGTVEAVLLAPRIEEAMRQSIQQAGGAGYAPAISPDEGQQLSSQVTSIAAAAASRAVLVTHFDIRRYVKKVMEPYLPRMPVLSFQEISAQSSLKPLGQVEG